jgi:hypothetical protein
MPDVRYFADSGLQFSMQIFPFGIGKMPSISDFGLTTFRSGNSFLWQTIFRTP